MCRWGNTLSWCEQAGPSPVFTFLAWCRPGCEGRPWLDRPHVGLARWKHGHLRCLAAPVRIQLSRWWVGYGGLLLRKVPFMRVAPACPKPGNRIAMNGIVFLRLKGRMCSGLSGLKCALFSLGHGHRIGLPWSPFIFLDRSGKPCTSRSLICPCSFQWGLFERSMPCLGEEFLVKTHDTPADYATERGENALMKAAANGHWEP